MALIHTDVDRETEDIIADVLGTNCKGTAYSYSQGMFYIINTSFKLCPYV